MLIVLRPVFNRVNLLLAGLVLLVLLAFVLITEPFLRRVCLSVFDAFMFLGALQVAGFATIRPLRVPLVQRYLRTVLLPVLPNIVVTPSSMLSVYRSRNSIYLLLRLRACTLLLAGLIRLVFFALRTILAPRRALVLLNA